MNVSCEPVFLASLKQVVAIILHSMREDNMLLDSARSRFELVKLEFEVGSSRRRSTKNLNM